MQGDGRAAVSCLSRWAARRRVSGPLWGAGAAGDAPPALSRDRPVHAEAAGPSLPAPAVWNEESLPSSEA